MKKALKKWIKDVVWRPRVGKCGSNSYIKWPRTIRHGECLEIGNCLNMLGYGVIDAVVSYADGKYTPKISIGHDVYIGSHLKIDCIERVEIGDGCVLSDFIHITDLSHGLNPKNGLIMRQNVIALGSVKLGRNCFVGLGSSILPGVELGEWCVVGARSVVTQSFPPFSMIAGAPARLVKRYREEENKWCAVKPTGQKS